MQPTTYQQPELRDANDQIIRSGTFGKNTALSNSTNDGWIDYVMNNLEYLYNNCLPLSGGTMTGGITPSSGNANLGSTTYRWGKVFAQEFDAPKRTISGKGSSLALPGYNRMARKTFTLANMTSAVSSGNYSAYDIEPGDYFTGASGYTYIFAGHNPLRGTYTGYPITADHAGLIVHTHTTSPWNDTNDTTGGYVSSKLHAYLVNTVLPKVKTDLGGVSHLYAHKKLYSTAVGTTLYNRYGSNTGASNNWAWSDSQYIAALSEVQVYGSTVWSSSGYDTGEADQQLEVFRRFKHTEIFGNESIWLRDVVSSSNAELAYYAGTAYSGGTSYAFYVAGLIAFH